MNSPNSSYLSSEKKVLEIIRKYHFYPAKKLGQNFLVDQNITTIMMRALELNRGDSIIEIGTGLGALTFPLALSAKMVYTFEKDKRFKLILDDYLLKNFQNIEVIYQDILKFDLREFLNRKRNQGIQIDRLAGNLPYSISLPLLRKLMDLNDLLQTAVIMVQKEVAERMVAQPGEKNYGVLSIISRYYSDIQKIHLVRPGVFFPKPQVDSMILKLTFLKTPPVIAVNEKLLFELIHAVFQHRRKNIFNALKIFYEGRIDKDDLEKMLRKMGINLDSRGESFHLKDFARLSDEMDKILVN